MTISGTGRRDPSVTQWIAATLLFLVATVVLTYPLAFHPASLSRLDNGDARLNAWAMSWVAHQVVHDPLALFDANTFYPLARTLAFSEHLTVQGLLAAPILAITNDLVLTHNLITLFAIFASALAMYWLAYSLTGSHEAAILAGLFFSFAPFRFNRLPHIQMQLYAFIPLTLLGVHRFLQTRQRRFLALASASFVLQALAGTYLGAICAIALATAMAVLLPTTPLRFRDWTALGAAFVLAALVLLPFTLPYLGVHRELGVEWDLGGLSSLSATWESYIASSSHLYRGLTESVTEASRRTDFLFPGLTLLVLGSLGARTLLGERERRPIFWCYAAILVAGLVLSLGPRTPIYPFLYEHVVFFRGLRALTRFALLPLLSLSVLSAVGSAYLLGHFERLSTRRALAAAIAVFFAVESTALPYQLEPHRDDPPEVYRWLREQAPGPIVELPFKVVDTRYMFWARHHGFRPMLNGDSGFIPMSHQWMKVALARFPSADAVALLRRLEVRYVVVHLGAFRARALPRLLTGLKEATDALLPVRDFGSQVVYEVLPDPDSTPTSMDARTQTALRIIPSESSEALFDGATDAALAGNGDVVEVAISLEAKATVTGVRLHYGAVPRAPVDKLEFIVDEGGNGPRVVRSTPDGWPAVTALVSGLLDNPLDGTQDIHFEPVEATSFVLRLRGIDGHRADVTELVVFGESATQVSRLNTGNR